MQNAGNSIEAVRGVLGRNQCAAEVCFVPLLGRIGRGVR
jgi:hypothetical protein